VNAPNDLVTISRAQYELLLRDHECMERTRDRSRRTYERNRLTVAEVAPQPVTGISTNRLDPDPQPVTGISTNRLDPDPPAGYAISARPVNEGVGGDAPPPPDLKIGGGAGGGVGELRAPSRSTRPPPKSGLGDRAVLDALWTEPRIVAVIEQRGLNADWERANFGRKPQGLDPRNWTVEYLEAWLLRSEVKLRDTAPLARTPADRSPQRQYGPAPGAYDHDPWDGRTPPIAEADLKRALNGTSS
jgi:hypothetical protein